MQPSTDLVLGHRYRLIDRIALGGMGEVWEAEDEVLARAVAVKMLRPELVEAPGFRQRLRAEARHAAGLAHAGIANVYDYAEDDSGAYLVMELVPGCPLSEYLAEQRVPPLATTLSILAQTAEALDAAHRGGVVHRDVKPGNIMVLPNGTVKVTDFGIAKAMEGATEANVTQPLTVHGQVIGTPQYMAPEQISGQTPTPATDIYSLGVIGYEMLRGERPFPGDNALALAVAHAHEVPPPLPRSIPDRVRDVIERAMAKDPQQRPPSAAAFAAELRALQMDLMPAPIIAAPVTPPPMSDPATIGPATVAAAGAVESATAVMPPGGVAVGAPLIVVDDAVVDGRSRRRSMRRLLPILAALACIGLVVLLVRLDSRASRGGLDAVEAAVSSAATSTVPADAAATTLPVTEAPTTVPPTVAPVTVDPQSLIGLSETDARNVLQSLGLTVDTRRVRDGRPVGTVVDVTPSGPVAPGSTVTLSISAGAGDKGKGGKGKGKG